MTKQELKAGREFVFTTPDEDMQATVWFDNSSGWTGGFKILFNGELLHSSKTFESFEKRFNTLKTKWQLSEVEAL